MHIHERAPVTRTEPLDQELLGRIDAYWRAANYLSVGQIYLLDNPLLKMPLTLAHIKPRLLGHWGTTPGLNFIYVHLNRIIKERDLNIIIFAYHGYPLLIHRLTYRRTNHRNLHVRGYKEEGTTTTPFDMTVLNDLDRFHLAMDAIDRLPATGEAGVRVKQGLSTKLLEHRRYIMLHGEDMPEILGWRWTPPASRGPA